LRASFRIPRERPSQGRYTIRVESPGFTIAQVEVDLPPGKRIKRDIVLQVGSVAETVVVHSVLELGVQIEPEAGFFGLDR